MTNLTSEQYRDVINHVPGSTEKIPSVQELLRLAVNTFYNRFGAYPELGAAAPGKIGLFGDQTQFSKGAALCAAAPLATVVVGRRAAQNRFTVVTTADVGKPHKVTFSFSRHRPLAPGSPAWLNCVKGVMDNYEGGPVPGFDAVVESSIPLGVGLGSSCGIEVATYTFLEVLVGKKAKSIDKVRACQRADAFAGREVGAVDRMTSVMAKDRHAMIVDCKTDKVRFVSFPRSKFAFVVVDTHVRDTLFGDEYPKEERYLAKACQMLKVNDLRGCTEDDLENLTMRVYEELERAGEEEFEGENSLFEEDAWTEEEYDVMLKRAKFFIGEMKRISEAVEDWKEGNVEAFGEKMLKSQMDLKENFDVNNPLVEFLVDSSLQVKGVFGSRMVGMGINFGGTIISLMKKKKVRKYCNFVRDMFENFQEQIAQELKEIKTNERAKRRQTERNLFSRSFGPSPSFPGRTSRGYLSGARRKSPPPPPAEKERTCADRRRDMCKVVRGKGKCATWPSPENEDEKEESRRRDTRRKREAREEEGEGEFESWSSTMSTVSDVKLAEPTFYLVSPLAGARMMFVTRADILRSQYARPVPDPKALVRAAAAKHKARYGTKLEAVGLAPATITLLGEFMEFHAGYLICMALPMYTVTLGGRNDEVQYAVKTTSHEVEKPTEMKCPLPCVRIMNLEERRWVNYVMGSVNEFKEHVPGFNGVIHSSIPIEVGINSCAALQASIYTFLEYLTREPVNNLMEKADRCSKSEFQFLPEPSEMTTRCSSIKFLPTFLSKEGHLTFINFKRYKISHYFFDHPAYGFLLAYCKNGVSQVTLQDLEERMRQCKEAVDALQKNSLLGADLSHLRCLARLVSSEEVIKRARYVITEHERSIDAVSAIRSEDYERLGVIMNYSHASLRDDYGVSSPQIETLISLALEVRGVLGAKMVGKGLNASIIILLKIADADKCMRHMRKNYEGKKDDLFFYLTKPSQGAFAMDPATVFLSP